MWRNRTPAKKETPTRFPCLDCSRCIMAINEYYMILDNVWAVTGVGFRDNDGFLCVGCLETRIGRLLQPADFTPCPLNLGFFAQSDRLVDRLGDTAWMTPAVAAAFKARR